MKFPYFGKPELTDRSRRSLSDNQFMELPGGVTHWEAAGPEDGGPVVFVHGLTSPMFIWDEQFYEFARRGYRVYRYDLYGRGLSDRPAVRYDGELYVRQLRNLLESLDPEKTVTLVGLSLGGVIVTQYMARYPDSVAGLLLVAPAGLAESMPWWYDLMTLPGVTETIYYGFGDFYFRYFGYRNLTSDPDRRARARKAMRQQLEFSGYLRSIISTLRHGPVYGEEDSYRTVGGLDCPVRAIWSRADRIVPYELCERLERYVPQAEVKSLPDGEHTVNYDKPVSVNEWMGEFLRSPSGKTEPQ